MDIKELKEAIKDIPDDVLVGNSGHYGEYLEVWGAYQGKCSESYRNTNKKIDVFIISTEDAGPEPD